MKQAKPVLKKRRGFSLVELLVAVTILVVGLLGLARLIATLTRSQLRSASLGEMTMVAQAKVEQIRAITATGVGATGSVAVGGSLTATTAPFADTVTAPNGRAYLRRWVVAAVATGSRGVTVRVQPLVASPRLPTRQDVYTVILIP